MSMGRGPIVTTITQRQPRRRKHGPVQPDETEGHLMVITINRPEVYNALHPMANQELSDAFDEFAADPELWVAIITGAGDKAFSAGNDLKYHAELRARTGGRPHSPPKGFGGLTNRYDLDKPVIAAVNGVAMGGGFEIALACRHHHRLGSGHASPCPSRAWAWRRAPAACSACSRQIPLKRAMGMMLTGRHVSAKEGYELGFVTAVVPHAELMREARTLGRPDPRMLAHEHPRDQAGGDALARRAGARDRRAQQPLPGLRRHGRERGHHRGPQGLRREAQARLERAVTVPALG